jgi:hypothetical protein
MVAYDRGDYATMLQLLRPIAERGMHKRRIVLVRCIIMEKVLYDFSYSEVSTSCCTGKYKRAVKSCLMYYEGEGVAENFVAHICG